MDTRAEGTSSSDALRTIAERAKAAGDELKAKTGEFTGHLRTRSKRVRRV